MFSILKVNKIGEGSNTTTRPNLKPNQDATTQPGCYYNIGTRYLYMNSEQSGQGSNSLDYVHVYMNSEQPGQGSNSLDYVHVYMNSSRPSDE